MEQKDYKLEIMSQLLNKEGHIRDLSRRLGTNHMTIVRKIKELTSENVVDFKKAGKNNSYFIKKSIEAKNYVYMSEYYKLNHLIKKYPSLRAVIEKIQNDMRIKLAILFGSYAKGIAKQDSDIDLYMDTEDKNLKKDIELIDSRLSVKIGKYDNSNLLIKEIENNHVIIKGVENYYERNEFFK